ncbi:MAG: DUF362 domain-containing protein [Planctomycetota bacterium]|jgi:uncharacterized protein (DUF362 family)
MVGIRFKEKMDGYLGENIKDSHDGEDYGIRHSNPIRFEVEIEIDSVDDFIQVSTHEAELRGNFFCKSLGDESGMAIENGRFNLFSISGEDGHRNMQYRFNFNAPDGKRYYLTGFKDIFSDRVVDVLEDMTTLFVRIYEGEDDTGNLYGSGTMYFRIKDIRSLIKMIKKSEVTGTRNPFKKCMALKKFGGFFMAETVKTYAPGPRFLYFTRYENLVLSGSLHKEGEAASRDFFFFSGEHDKGFPWGDGTPMSDVALLISDGQGGHLRFGITKYALDGLKVNLDGNAYKYEGELYRINEGHSVSFSEIRDYKEKNGIEKVRASISLTLEVKEYKKVDMTFKPIEKLTEHIPDKFEKTITKYLTTLPFLGYFTTPHKVKVTEGAITITTPQGDTTYTIDPEGTHGEGELGYINNLKDPSMYYNYLCGIDPAGESILLKITSGTLRNERECYFKDIIDKTLGKVIERNIKKNLLLKDSVVENPAVPTVEKTDVLTLVNDHYPTGVLLRRIVEVQNNGKKCYGLEEYIDAINTAPIEPDKEVQISNPDKEAQVTVLTYKDRSKYDGKPHKEDTILDIYNSEEKFNVLDNVIKEIDFFKVLEDALNKSGKSREDFSIAIKPNFMFFYSLKDKSTYTDPTLVKHLVDRIYEKGFRDIKIVEARSTLSVFFQNRDVKSVAQHIGYEEGGKYQIIDLSDNCEDYDFGGTLGRHPVNKEWKSADFRISFAKNKTHSYAYYTLTMKNIYGALSKEYKFKVYHCEMGDIYKPTIDFIKAFPIHFGFIDAVVSADGPFGIFADPDPQLTMTIIGGENIVAVDWVGAAKMGIDPMLSRYMQEAVKVFGKPRIRVKGDDQLYKFWANTPRIAAFGSDLLDKNFTFGYPVYYLMSEMDPKFPSQPDQSHLLTALRAQLGEARAIVYKTDPPPWMQEFVRDILKAWE